MARTTALNPGAVRPNSGQLEDLSLVTRLTAASSAGEAADAVMDAIEAATGVARSAVLLFALDGVCRFVGSRGLSDEYRKAVEGHCPWAEGDRSASTILVDDVLVDPSLEPYLELFRREHVRSLAFVPVVTGQGVVGKLMLYEAGPHALTSDMIGAADRAGAYLGLCVDRIQTRERLLNSEHQLRTIIDTALDAVILMGADGKVTDWNRQAQATFGWTSEEAIGALLADLIIPHDLIAAHRRGLKRYLHTGEGKMVGRRIEMPAVRKDGGAITVELAISPIETNFGLSFSAFLRDVTERKNHERALEAAKALAEAGAKAKGDFLAMMSHEIRTPMNGVIGIASLLLGTRLSKEQAAYAQTIVQSGEALMTILNDILDFSRIETGNLKLEQTGFDLRDAVEEAHNLMAAVAKGKGLSHSLVVDPDVPRSVMGDPIRVRQVLFNVVGNAIKFTSQGGVTTRVTAEHGGVCIAVTDSGPGIPAATLPKLFRPFTQGDASTTRRHGGTGLGLAICERLVSMMGGEIAVHSKLGEGSCFEVRLPLPRATTAQLVVEQVDLSANEPPSWRARVLVAEDNEVNRLVAVKLLERLGCQVEVASDGLEAVKMHEREPYDLIFMDCHMPTMDGFEATKRIRRGNGGANVMIVALTANALKTDQDICLAAGMNDHVPKPVKLAHFQRVLGRWADAA